MIDSTISSPGSICARPNEDATRLIASVARAGEDDLVGRFRVEEGAHFLARVLVGVGRGIGEIMQAAMHIGVFMLVDMGHALDHLPRLLRRGGIVEIDERLAVGLFAQDRKILAHLDRVEGSRSIRCHVCVITSPARARCAPASAMLRACPRP